ncbi:pyridoxamine 5'-phosphate oxidase family protein [Paenibacillus sp. P96]|uniref:Pyridoxamine 5'-phosphate oxidase family protein n=1 Tax=Paenibacillus zeirhizosphaerae TaxID=2987519 RepID=A0ABT9FKM0_9BACL|nr:MSMEG_1061 family FMN-dependent PPOX-type flavoprotein [Paenibacillus sp. P96]MDP4095272.1 pyridoxamine 5'-phosphate oxidase family protein [Paenibacillus sp. P96]
MNSPSWMQQAITSPDELRGLVGTPSDLVQHKVVSVIEEHIRGYLQQSPLFFLATSDAEGRCDASPRGDTPGFVKVLDERRLVFPERPGNKRIDSLLNIIANPQVGLIFLIPGLDEVLRINGKAWVTRSPELLEQMQWDGKTMDMCVVVEVEECFIHCPRAFKQSKLWNPDAWPEKEHLPSIMEMFRAHVQLNKSGQIGD